MAVIDYHKYNLYDNIYGNIWMSEYEYRIVNTPLFHRLHRIRQMGWSYSTFPSAMHTRFSHSLGVLYIISKILDEFRDKDGINDPHIIAELRMAALLHDIGHLPLSHIGERATSTAYREPTIDDGKITPSMRPPMKNVRNLHEYLSATIVENNDELKKIFKDLKEKDCDQFDVQEVVDIIKGTTTGPHFSILLSSELDADRLDYLIRDSAFTGVNYGKIELDYIVSNLKNKRLRKKDGGYDSFIAVDNNAIHGVEHYVLARFFQNIQVIKSPKIYLMDFLAQEVYEYMIKQKDMCVYSKKEIDDLVRDNSPESKHKLYEYTDDYIFIKMRKLHEKLDKEIKDDCCADEKTEFINDAIKIIMDGNIPEPLLVRRELYDFGTHILKCSKCNSENPETAKYCINCGEEFEENPVKYSKLSKIQSLRVCLESKRKNLADALGTIKSRIVILNVEEKIGKYYMSDQEEDRSKSIKLWLDPEIDYLSNRDYTLIGQLRNRELRGLYLFCIPSKTNDVSWWDSHKEDKQKVRAVIGELDKIFDDKVHKDFQKYNFTPEDVASEDKQKSRAIIDSELDKIFDDKVHKDFQKYNFTPEDVASKVGSRTVSTKAEDSSSRINEAIMVLDICKHSSVIQKLGGDNLVAMLSTLDSIVRDVLGHYNCQYISSRGDGYLTTFLTAFDALSSAISILNKLKEYNKKVKESNRISLRFVVNYGETIIGPSGDRIGERVTETFRIEELRNPDLPEWSNGKRELPERNYILVSERAYNELKDSKDYSFKLIGVSELQ